MPGFDTSMGGELSRFPSTSLTMLLHSGADAERRCREHLERLASKYWKPIYAYIRRVWSKSDADAKDLTQSFLVHLLEHDLLVRFDRGRGNFRSYLKQCVKNFLSANARDAARLKRGGGQKAIPLEDAQNVALRSPQGTPEEDFDRDWEQEVLDRSLRETEEHFRGQNKAVYFEAFRAYALADSERAPSYREIGERLGISESDVRNYLRFVRRELRTQVIRIISEYVVNEEDITAEAARIIGERE